MHEVTVDPSHTDTDPQETAEWRDAFTALRAAQGPERARFMLDELARQARTQQEPQWHPATVTNQAQARRTRSWTPQGSTSRCRLVVATVQALVP